MDMNTMDGGGMGGSGDTGLTTEGFNLTNKTDATAFLTALLDDMKLQPVDIAIARAFWCGIIIVIAIFALVNLSFTLTLRARLRAAAAGKPHPACPRNLYTRIMATATAIVRELSYPQYSPPRFSRYIKFPPAGVILLLLCYLGFVLGLEYYNNSTPGAQHYEAWGLRAAWLAIAQLPLLILLVGKFNLIGLVTGLSHERMNIFHRYVGRVIWLMATLHMGYQQWGWSQFQGIYQLETATDYCWPTGLTAWSLLTWLNVSSIGPLRHWHYEFFVAQHILTFFGFMIAIAYHIPVIYARVFIYIPAALFLVDRLVRYINFAYINSRMGRATITALPGNVSKIQVQSCRIKSWSAGQHVLLSIPKFGMLQSHPATILSTPTSHNGDLVFILKAHKGFTSRLYKSSSQSTTALISSKPSFPADQGESGTQSQSKYIALLSGPYGNSHADFAAFSSAFLIAGSTGITFILPILLSLATRAESTTLPLKHISVLWIIKSSTWTTWVAPELETAITSLRNSGIKCEIHIATTCDDTLTDSNTTTSLNPNCSNPSEKNVGCQCVVSDAPCCCVEPPDSDDEDSITPAQPPYNSSTEKPSSLSSLAKLPTTKTTTTPPTKTITTTITTTPLAALATLRSGRPPIEEMLWHILEVAQGETGVAVCGPMGLSARTRRAVATASDARGVHKGTGAWGVYLHVEGFEW